MLKHYFLIAARQLIRHRLYSFINITGLALGLACVILIALYVRFETSYDKWLPGTERVYKLEMTANIPGRSALDTALVPFPVSAAMAEKIPGVVAATRLRPEMMTLTAGNREFLETVDVVDPNFLEVIRLPLISGHAATAMTQPESVLLSRDASRKFFGDANPIGRTITVRRRHCMGAGTACADSTIDLTVTGVIRNLPRNSQLTAEALIPDTSSADMIGPSDKHDWLSASYYGYVKLAPHVAPAEVLARLATLMDDAMGPGIRQRHLSLSGSRLFEIHLMPFTRVHLDSAHDVQNLTPAGSRITVYGLIVIGTLILLLACFNFMNLATARAMLRSREISLRKCVGASRPQLIAQFLGESVGIALCALLLALALVELLLPAFDSFITLPLAFHYVRDASLSLLIVAIAIAAGLISGGYPALILSGFRPGAELRSNSSGPAGSGRLRATVLLQFAVSIGLAIAALVVSSQIGFARGMALGFDPNGVVVMRTGGDPGTQGFRRAVGNYPGVLGAALSSDVPFSSGHPVGLVQLPGRPDTLTVDKLNISSDFPRLYSIRLLAGRLLAEDRGTDTLSDGIDSGNEGHSILVNEAAAAAFGYTPAQAIDKTIIYNSSPVKIVGVLADTKFRGAMEPVRPTVYFYDRYGLSTLSIRVSGQHIPETLAFIDRTWRDFAPLTSSQRYFLSADMQDLYRSYQKQGVMFEVFVGIAMAIACLGLLGLAVFTAERRTKEIGIRKVSGARTADIVRLMLWRISVPVLAANLISWPVAYYYLHRWLEGYAYRIPLSPLYFLAAGATALLIAWATVCAHTLQLARMRPIHALRYE
ncbi:MAG: ABC transporter permease [Steroidobacteraceae bacterium]